ncbi:MAG TPA: thioredoxin domain-containing protein [Acidimicrobiales bacterium]|nr:thioredoxin domain-containing protein [Acidimicrobiales bacterium]
MSPQNRLAQETSPYLQQHKDNPVDWYPWSEEAFAKARDEDKAVLLSVGYSACHWCHVMAHESFEDGATAAIMNERFVNVKVDREERPDVDAVYMEATQAMTGRGGWPMTVFVEPEEQRPFYAGTYYPPTPRHGMPSFTDVMDAVSEAWVNRRDDVLEQADQVTDAVRQRSSGGFRDRAVVAMHERSQGAFDPFPATVGILLASHDGRLGGFGAAPKFPQPSMLDALLIGAREANVDARVAAIRTLDAMAAGGIHDHLGGGFSRYCVDAAWLVPHFEKMLYDQAGFVRVYTHGAQLTGNSCYARVVTRTVDYVLRDLRLEGGGIASAEDADSEGHEGLFYTWTPEEIRAVLHSGNHDDPLADDLMAFYGVAPGGNFEGRNILFRPIDADPSVPPRIAEANQRLLDARATRVRPLRDDKVITEFNAMFVAALVEAGAALARDDWVAAAVDIAEFLLDNLRRNGRWMRAWQSEAGAQHLAVAGDVAWLVDAFTRLSEATGNARWIDEARGAADALLDLFWDSENNGLFTVGRDAPALVANPKETFDGATPSANAVGALALARLGALTGDERYTDHARKIIAGLPVGDHPAGFSHASYAAHLLARGVTEVVIPGRGEGARALVDAYRAEWRPFAVVAWGDAYDSPLWHGRNEGNAYVCRDYVCELPVREADDLAQRLTNA